MTRNTSRPLGANERRHPRRPITARALLVLDEGQFAVVASVVDLSESGAQVRLPLGIAIPEHIHLVTLNHQVAYECAIAWRKPPLCGVRFLARYALDALPPDREYLAQAWREHTKRTT